MWGRRRLQNERNAGFGKLHHKRDVVLPFIVKKAVTKQPPRRQKNTKILTQKQVFSWFLEAGREEVR